MSRPVVRRGRSIVALAAFVLAMTAALVGAGPARASCAGNPSIPAAVASGGPIFVGTVISTTNEDRWATFAVEEVWAGDVADTQEVLGAPKTTGEPGKFPSFSEQRTYQLGQRYLVDAHTGGGPYELKPGEMGDTDCSATTPWTDSLAAERPPTARIVARSAPIETLASAMTDPDRGGSDTGLLLAVLAIVTIVGLCLWFLFRRGSINDRAEVDVPIPDDESREPPGESSVGWPGDEPDRPAG